MFGRTSPGACPICGAEHTTCTAGTGPITSVMTPARDCRVPTHDETLAAAQSVSPTAVSTKTYRGKAKP